ncbi:MAG: hypothetical protein R3C56_36435 [Pirellulaceae bacterium]
MSRATRLPKPLMFSMAALCGLLTVSSSAMGQGATDGGFGNFGRNCFRVRLDREGIPVLPVHPAAKERPLA